MYIHERNTKTLLYLPSKGRKCTVYKALKDKKKA